MEGLSDGLPNTRLFLSPRSFDRFFVTREINDGLLAPRFEPSQRAWVLSGFLTLRLPKLVPPTLVANLEALLGEKKFREAFELIRGDSSLFGRSLTAGVERLSQGWDKALDSMLHEVEDGKIVLEQSITPVAVFGQLGPMIGYAATATIRASTPRREGEGYVDRFDYYEYIQSIPAPLTTAARRLGPPT